MTCKQKTPKLFKIRNKRTGEFYLICNNFYEAKSQSNSIAVLKFTSFDKSKSYTRRGTAKGVMNKFIKARIAVDSEMGNLLLDLPILELVEYDVVEVVK